VSQDFEVPGDGSVDRARIAVEIDDKTSPNQHEIPVRVSRYYASVGVLFPFVINGEQELVGRALPGSAERTLDVKRSLYTLPAIVLNVHPGGRRVGTITPFDRRCKKAGKELESLCHRRRLAEIVGLQFGVDVDLAKPLDQFFAGLSFEFVTGVSINVGMAVKQMRTLRSGDYVGQLITDEAMLSGRLAWGVRFYSGLTLSFDVISAIRSAKDRR
jgi:hypothetical protein